jgi:uncharacterized protein
LANYKDQGRNQKSSFSLDNYKKIIDFVFSEYSDRKTLLFNFFGGEPLLEFQLVRVLVSYIHKLVKKTKIRVSFAINTNGTLLDREKLDFLKSNNFYLGFSIDGPEDVHDANRPMRNGGATFHHIMEGIDMVKKYYPLKRTKVASMFDRHSMEISRTLNFTTKLGLPQITIDKAKGSPQESGHITSSHLPFLIEEQEKIARKILHDIKERKMDSYIIPFHGVLSLLITKQLISVRNCEAGENQITFSGDGCIYPCYWMDGKRQYAIGSVSGGIDKQKKKEWLNFIEKEEEKCQACIAENLCGHGCQITQLLFNEADDTQCCLMQNRVEICIWIAKSLNQEDLDYFLKQSEILQ